MAITPGTPRVIHLGGPITRVNTLAAIEAITPGMLLELHNDSGTAKYGVHDSADTDVSPTFALQQTMLNKGVDEAYAAGDLVEAAIASPGATIWALIPSGVTVNPGDLLQSNGDGKLKALASGKALAVALEAKTATADTRIRVEIL